MPTEGGVIHNKLNFSFADPKRVVFYFTYQQVEEVRYDPSSPNVPLCALLPKLRLWEYRKEKGTRSS